MVNSRTIASLLPDTYEHEIRVEQGGAAGGRAPDQPHGPAQRPLRLRFEQGTVTMSAQTPDVGEASETLPVNYQGEQLEIGFNPQFLQDGLESVESDELRLKLISPLRPGLLEAAGDEGRGQVPLPDHAGAPERLSGEAPCAYVRSLERSGTSATTSAPRSSSTPGVTVLEGPVGAGKTNLLEALYVGCVGRSFRTSNDRELIRFGEHRVAASRSRSTTPGSSTGSRS